MVHSVGEQKMSVFSARYRWQIIATMTGEYSGRFIYGCASCIKRT